VFGCSLLTVRYIHRSCGIMSVCLLAFHVATQMVGRKSFPLDVPRNVGGLVVSSSCLAFRGYY
jgi:hypothetical protein